MGSTVEPEGKSWRRKLFLN